MSITILTLCKYYVTQELTRDFPALEGYYAGADSSSADAAELTALVEALEFTRAVTADSEPDCPDLKSVTIYCGSEYAANVTSGRWAALSNVDLVRAARLLLELLRHDGLAVEVLHSPDPDAVGSRHARALARRGRHGGVASAVSRSTVQQSMPPSRKRSMAS